ncbi:hypothetical protein VNO80_13383 [Phaseolus coccineus]|uniref:Uncharacterized protein n=1 Tax=Phaseolus coccineus TaxID=3886 RepID=A0AAN9N7C8_PHACN
MSSFSSHSSFSGMLRDVSVGESRDMVNVSTSNSNDSRDTTLSSWFSCRVVDKEVIVENEVCQRTLPSKVIFPLDEFFVGTCQKAYFKELLKMCQGDVMKAGKVSAKMVQPLQTISGSKALLLSNPTL